MPLLSIAPTATLQSAAAGEGTSSSPSFPIAITTTIPAALAWFTSCDCESEPSLPLVVPSDIDITCMPLFCSPSFSQSVSTFSIQASIASLISALEPDPQSAITFISINLAPGAIPR